MNTLEDTTQINEPDFSYAGEYTYADYLKWTIEERLELIKGKIFRMPESNTLHQEISGAIAVPLWSYLRGQKAKVFTAPFDVRFPHLSTEDMDILTVVQPDICVICDPALLDDRGGIGAPNIVVEILSPGNNAKDLHEKYDVYEAFGVQEYWIVLPLIQAFQVCTLIDGKFSPSRLMTHGDIVTTPILPGFELDLAELFKED